MSDPAVRSPLVDLVTQPGADPAVKMLAARGVLAPRALDQLMLLMVLSGDPDPEVAAAAEQTLARLPREALARFLARPDAGDDLRRFFAGRGVAPSAPSEDGSDADAPLVEHAEAGDTPPASADEADAAAETAADGTERVPVASLPVAERLKLALKGTREQRAQLIRDPNRIVAAAVLSSPKVNESEIEAFAKLGNVSEDVLRAIANNRAWLKQYGIVLALARNPKTPPGVSMPLLRRLTARDIKAVVRDRNVPEAVRLQARRLDTARQP
jgi:hypothetical protein